MDAAGAPVKWSACSSGAVHKPRVQASGARHGRPRIAPKGTRALTSPQPWKIPGREGRTYEKSHAVIIAVGDGASLEDDSGQTLGMIR